MSKGLRACVCALASILMPLTSRADLYSAAAAFEAKEFERAFELYRELAEMGQPEAQETLAVMYVNGEGVKRNNVLGYAWASLALGNGGGEASRGIVSQIEPHLTPAARVRIAEVHSKFGNAALEERLLPKAKVSAALNAKSCKMRSVANPDSYYPPEARRQMIAGTVLVEATVAPDGHARNVRAWYALPAKGFDEAARRVAFANVYEPPKENGVAIACTVRFKVKFQVAGAADATAEQRRLFADVRAKAEAGDPRSQFAYALLLELRPDLSTQEQSTNWTLKAAQAGVASAQYLIGMQALYAASRGLEKSDSKGLTWLQMAADAGQSDAQTALANYLLRTRTGEELKHAQDLLEEAAASGHKDGKFYLAAILAAGPDASRLDPKRALDLLEEVRSDLDLDPTFFEVRAAAKAMLGEFAQAQDDQKVALLKARKLGWDIKPSEARLANYAASKTWTGNFFVY